MTEGIASIEVIDPDKRFDLPWDRFIRLKVVADALSRLTANADNVSVLDVGGFDGAFAMFGKGWHVDLIDPETTGGSGLSIPSPDKSYDFVVSIDAIEHVSPDLRQQFLAEISRVSLRGALINYPSAETMACQELVLSITGHEFIRQHVEFGLPSKDQIKTFMQKSGFVCSEIPSGSLSTWAAQFTLASLHPEAAAKISRYLVENHSEEPFSVPLYELIVCTRES